MVKSARSRSLALVSVSSIITGVMLRIIVVDLNKKVIEKSSDY